MKEKIKSVVNLAFTKTAKDTYVLYAGNIISAFLGFLFTWVVARYLSLEDFGILSAATNFIVILVSLTDVGLSSGLVNFVSQNLEKGEEKKAREYIKAGFVLRFITIFIFSLFTAIFAKFVSVHYLATSDVMVAYFVSLISFGLFSWVFWPYILMGMKRFAQSVMVDLSLGVTRIATLVLFVLGGLSLYKALGAYAISTIPPILVGILLVGHKFLREKPGKKIYKDLISFSGWLGVNRIVSSISGRLDVQMTAAILGATATAIYSIPSKLSSFVIVLASSFSSVLAPRMASFNDREKEKDYLKKALLAVLGISFGVVLWILIARPFILILFGERYEDSIVVFRALSAAMIPFLFTTPAVTAIIYALKKPVYIGVFSFVQLGLIYIFNTLFIARFGVLGPTLSFAIVHVVLAIYVWTIVIKHYWFSKS